MTETFYIIGILGRADGARGNWLRAGLILGVALAVTVLLRQIFLLFVPLLFGWLMWRSYRHNARPVAHMCGALAAAALILMLSILPWTARNYSAFGQFVLLNTNAGFAFFWGNHPIHGYNFIAILPPGGPTYQSLIPAELHSLNEAELDRTLLKQGLGFIQAEPGRYLVLSFSRIKDYFVFWPSARSGAISNLSRVASFGLCLPFMLYGLWLGRRSWPQASLLYLFVTAYTAIHLMVWALIRYRLPIDAVLVIFAGMAVVDIYLTVTGTRLVQAGAAALPLRPNPGK